MKSYTWSCRGCGAENEEFYPWPVNPECCCCGKCKHETDAEWTADIELTGEYWDCECEKDYIHPRLQESCPLCKAASEDQPDSRVPEVAKFGFVMLGQETAETKAKGAKEWTSYNNAEGK